MSESRVTTLLWAQVIALAVVLVVLVGAIEFLGFADITVQLFLMSLLVFLTAPLVITSVVGGIGGWYAFIVALVIVSVQAALDVTQFGIRVALLRADLLHVGFLIVNGVLMALSVLSLVLMWIEYWARRSSGDSTATLDVNALTNTVRVVGLVGLVASMLTLIVVLPLLFALLGAFPLSLALLLLSGGHVGLGLYAALVDFEPSAALSGGLILFVLLALALDLTQLIARLLNETTMPSLTSITADNIADMVALFIAASFVALSAVYLSVTAWLWRERGLTGTTVAAAARVMSSSKSRGKGRLENLTTSPLSTSSGATARRTTRRQTQSSGSPAQD